MALELARVKLRGGYAAFAGVMLLIGIPLFESVFLGQAYVSAVSRSGAHGTFAPLLVWVGQHPGADLAFHIVELVPFLLAALLPGVLRRVLWPRGTSGGRVVAIIGQVGFALFALAVLLGIPISRGAASDYLSAGSAARAASITQGFANAFGFQNLLSHVIGGVLVALYIVVVSVRIVRTPVFSRWLGYYGLVPAVLLGATAFQYLGSLAQIETPLSPLAFAALAFWLLLVGVLLARLSGLTVVVDAATPPPTTAPTDATTPAPSSDASSASPTRQ